MMLVVVAVVGRTGRALCSNLFVYIACTKVVVCTCTLYMV